MEAIMNNYAHNLRVLKKIDRFMQDRKSEEDVPLARNYLTDIFYKVEKKIRETQTFSKKFLLDSGIKLDID